MSRGDYHWSLFGALHPGVDPDTCDLCVTDAEAALTASLVAVAFPPSAHHPTPEVEDTA